MGAVDDALARLGEMAEELKLADDEKEGFIEASMKRLGFTQTSAWAEPDDGNSGGGGGDFFSRKNAPRERRPARPAGGGGLTRYGS
jgi:hypothetical protein